MPTYTVASPKDGPFLPRVLASTRQPGAEVRIAHQQGENRRRKRRGASHGGQHQKIQSHCRECPAYGLAVAIELRAGRNLGFQTRADLRQHEARDSERREAMGFPETRGEKRTKEMIENQ